MSPGNKPKLPTKEEFKVLASLTIDIINGRVYAPKRSDGWGGKELVGFRGRGRRVAVSIITDKQRMISRAHIIWWKYTGRWPTMTIDHIDRNPNNDRIDNLREATMTLQNRNKDRPGGWKPWRPEKS